MAWEFHAKTRGGYTPDTAIIGGSMVRESALVDACRSRVALSQETGSDSVEIKTRLRPALAK